jgi:hypothetical protein
MNTKSQYEIMNLFMNLGKNSLIEVMKDIDRFTLTSKRGKVVVDQNSRDEEEKFFV